MIRTNLATRPFYNEQVVRLVLLLAAIVAIVVTAFNVTRIMQLSRRDTRLTTQASREEERAAALRRQAAQLRASIDPHAIDLAAADARKANELIDQRTFSWTELFNRFEMTLPDEVRITAVRPSLDPSHGIVLDIAVVARDREVVNQFIENLESSGVFSQQLAREDHLNEENFVEASLEMTYLPEGRPAGPGAAR